MPDTARPALSVAGLFAERDARRQRDREAEEQLKRRQEEELTAFKKRLDEFQLTEAHVEAVMGRIRRAFDRGETELMLTSFPSSFCTDNGRSVGNADTPPINRPHEIAAHEPEWLATLPAGARPVYEYWRENLRSGGFGFSARIVNYPGGKPGDVGLYLSWPKSSMDVPK